MIFVANRVAKKGVIVVASRVARKEVGMGMGIAISVWAVVDFLKFSWWRWRTDFFVISLVASRRRIF